MYSAVRGCLAELEDHPNLILTGVRRQRLDVAGHRESGALIEPKRTIISARDPEPYSAGTRCRCPVQHRANQIDRELGTAMSGRHPHTDELSVSAQVVLDATN